MHGSSLHLDHLDTAALADLFHRPAGGAGEPTAGLRAGNLRYLALGDSYTIGTGASSAQANFPTLIARRLAAATARLVDVTNPARSGQTADDVIRRQLPLLASIRPDRVSILIGANDIAQGRTGPEYLDSLRWIYEAVDLAGVPGRHVAAISVPDWSVTPAAAAFGPREIVAARIAAVNAGARREAGSCGLLWVDISEVSRAGPAGPPWLSADGLHPADAQYAAWADTIWPVLAESWAST